MSTLKATLISTLVCLIGSFAIANAAHMGGTMSAGTPTVHAQPTSAPHAPVTMVKIRTPGQCFRYCRGTLGAGIGFCAVSCYR